MYRVLDDLEWSDGSVLRQGTLHNLKHTSQEVIEVLLKRGLISKVQSPPLGILPGWEDRAEALEGAGVEDVNDLLEADLPALSEELDTPLEELEQSATEALQYVQ